MGSYARPSLPSIERRSTVLASARVMEHGSYCFQSASRIEVRGDYTINSVYVNGEWLIQGFRMNDR